MMMRMLAAGGLDVLGDDVRAADIDNPGGYFEYEPVKGLAHGRVDWLDQGRGRVVKVVAPLLIALPATHRYRVVFVRRRIDDVVASQQSMLTRIGSSAPATETLGAVREALIAQLDEVVDWLDTQPNIDVHYCAYERILVDPANAAATLATFLNRPFDQSAAAAVVDAAMPRHCG